jgi:hypothetical protein
MMLAIQHSRRVDDRYTAANKLPLKWQTFRFWRGGVYTRDKPMLFLCVGLEPVQRDTEEAEEASKTVTQRECYEWPDLKPHLDLVLNF